MASDSARPLKGDTVDFLDLLARMIAAFVSAIRFLQAPSRATATTAAVTVEFSSHTEATHARAPMS